MLFRKKIEPRCTYCARGAQLEEGHVFCIKQGVVLPEHHCHAFRYDPLRRTPSPPTPFLNHSFSKEDFSLD